jgi:hypothetical protein
MEASTIHDYMIDGCRSDAILIKRQSYNSGGGQNAGCLFIVAGRRKGMNTKANAAGEGRMTTNHHVTAPWREIAKICF